MIHVLCDYQGNYRVQRIYTCTECIFPASCGNDVAVLDVKYILFSLLKLEKMSLVGHYLMAREVHIAKYTAKLPLSHYQLFR